eukprot:scaffold161074_cov32-Tisochrysis_lutea.AAC.5
MSTSEATASDALEAKRLRGLRQRGLVRELFVVLVASGERVRRYHKRRDRAFGWKSSWGFADVGDNPPGRRRKSRRV